MKPLRFTLICAVTLGLAIVAMAQDSLNVRMLGSFDLNWYWTTDVVKTGNIAYAGDPNVGLRIVNVANPAFPVEVGRYIAAGGISRFEMAGTKLYCLCVGTGLTILDITDPLRPAALGQAPDGGEPRAITVAEPYVYIVSWVGIRTIDVSDPAAPVVICDRTYNLGVSAVAADEQYVYCVSGSTSQEQRLDVLDVTDPANPSSIGNCIIPVTAVESAVVRDGHLFVAARSAGVYCVDVTNPNAPAVVGHSPTRDWAMRVALDGDYAYVADDAAGMSVLNISNPTEPILLGNYATEGWAEGIFYAEPYVYMTAGSQGILVLDASNPDSPACLGELGDGHVGAIVTSGDYAFFEKNEHMFSVASIADPTRPEELARLRTDYEHTAIGVIGSYVITRADIHGIGVVDITHPREPAFVGITPVPDETNVMTVEGNFAYCLTYRYELPHHLMTVVDLTDPRTPVVAGSCEVPEWCDGLAVHNGYAYVLGNSLLTIIDVHNPDAPQLVRQEDMPGGNLIAIHGSLALVRGHEPMPNFREWARLYDLSDPLHPQQVWEQLDLQMLDITFFDSYLAYVESVHYGLVLMDIHNPANPSMVGYYSPEVLSPGFGPMTYANGVLLARYGYGFGVFAIDIAGADQPGTAVTNEFALNPAYPNPFNSSTRISFTLPRTQRVDLSLYDVLGRKVRDIVNDVCPGGKNELVFQADGLSSGVYFLCLRSSALKVQKLTILK